MSEELDIVKSLELTAEGSYDEGYREGRQKGIDEMREEVQRLMPVPSKMINEAAKRLKEQG